MIENLPAVFLFFPAGDAASEEDMLRAAVTMSLETAKDNLKAERKK